MFDPSKIYFNDEALDFINDDIKVRMGDDLLEEDDKDDP